MDFDALLHIATKNQMKRPEPVKCLQTKFKPPTKEQKDRAKSLNEGVQRFLARKEEEERKKQKEAARRREELSAARAKDPKANKRIQHMLKRTKSANKSVMNDVDQSNTADTISGPLQPDDDDYGFTSEASSALYNKLMQKMYNEPSSDLKFAPSKKPTGGNIMSTKERVKMALLKQEEDDRLPHKRKRRKREGGGDNEEEEGVSYGAPDRNGDSHSSRDSQDRKSEKPKPKRLLAAPPMDFMELLRIAEKKQHEPVVIEPKVKKDAEPEQLLTKKQKEELRKAEELKRQKEARARGEVAPSAVTLKRIPKIGESKTDLKNKPLSQKPEPPRSSSKSDRGSTEGSLSSKSKPIPRKGESETEKLKRERDQVLKELKEKEEAFRLLEEKERIIRERDEALAKLKAIEAKETKYKDCDKLKSTKDMRRPEPLKSGREFPSKDVPRPSPSSKDSLTSKDKKILPSSSSKDLRKPDPFKSPAKLTSKDGMKNGSREFPPKDVRSANGSREFPPRDVRPANGSREFPPRDVRPANGSREFPPRDVRPANAGRPGKRPMTKEEYIKKKLNELKKRRIEDSDEEYDSEMDDFIDDGPDPGFDGSEDVSDVIKQIFKYDKNRFSGYDDDDECMESNWGQVEREEKHSAKIGYLEDVADMLEEKKALARKKQKR